MSDRPVCSWMGASGKRYTYYVWARPPNIAPYQYGNYIYARLDLNGIWVPVFIGHGNLFLKTAEPHEKTDCINDKEATNVHIHLNTHKYRRMVEQFDIVTYNPKAYAPIGCNGRENR